MDTVRLALRFRDTTTAIDTIAEHKNILANHGRVFWGWWRKDFEPDHSKLLNSLSGPVSALLVNRTQGKAYSCIISRWIGRDIKKTENILVPSYYLGSHKKVFGWFEISSIEDAEYLVGVANRFGDDTLIALNLPAKEAEVYATKPLRNGNSVLILSDIHFGPNFDFLPPGVSKEIAQEKFGLTECLVADLRRIGLANEIAGILFNGDFTTAGDWSEPVKSQIVKEVAHIGRQLRVPNTHIKLVPGNHDIVRYDPDLKVPAETVALQTQITYSHEHSFRAFMNEAIDLDFKAPLNRNELLELRDFDIVVSLLNSCTILATEWTEYGFVGEKGIHALIESREVSPRRKHYRLMALHHHLLPVTNVMAPQNKGVSLTLDAVKILQAAQDSGIQIAIHGHEHMPGVSKYRNLISHGGTDVNTSLSIISCGSCGVDESRRPGRERNTYAVLRFNSDGALLTIRELRSDKKEGGTIFEGKVADGPYEPNISANQGGTV